MTIEEFDKLSSSIQGNLWPVCKNCKHIAQNHDNHISQPQENSCCGCSHGQCSECGHWADNVKCKCKGYDGPKDVNELIEYLNNKIK